MQPTREFLLYIIGRTRGLLGRKLPGSTKILVSIDIKASKQGDLLSITFLYEGHPKEVFLRADFERVSGILSLYTLYYEVDLLKSLESRLEDVLAMRNKLAFAYSKLDESEIFLIARTRLPLKSFKTAKECIFYLAEIDIEDDFNRIQKRIFDIKSVQRLPSTGPLEVLAEISTVNLRPGPSSQVQAPRHDGAPTSAQQRRTTASIYETDKRQLLQSKNMKLENNSESNAKLLRDAEIDLRRN